MIKGWKFSKKRPQVKVNCSGEYGCVYAVKIDVIQGLTLVKIGATRNPNERLLNFPARVASIYCVSPPHLNFFENEAILHEHFARFRVPSRGKGEGPEFFNMSLPYFFEHLPTLIYAQDETEATFIEHPTYGKLYCAKK